MFIIDFDDTLFNTRPAFNAACIDALCPLGVSIDLYEKTSRESRVGPHGEALNYSPARHAKVMAAHGFSEEQLIRVLNTVVSPARLTEFLYPDTLSFLKKLKALGKPLVLLSIGEEDFQSRKVRGCGVHDFFDRVFIAAETKEHVVRELLDAVTDSTVWFINDRVDQTLELYKQFPRLSPILKESVRGGTAEEYRASGLPHFKTLTEVYDYIISKQ